ncbi:MAG TPA: hypothetical protein DCZ76_09295 [Treponema sp.]|nr:hypothetical protein [Treponema sp.]
MATRNITEKQAQKLRDAGILRKNGNSINKSHGDAISYDKNGGLKIDMRTREGKEINKILNSRNRSSPTEKVSYQDKAYSTLEKRISKDFSDKADHERERLADLIINKVERTEQDSWYKARRAGQTKEYWLNEKAKECEKEYAKRQKEEIKHYTSKEERMEYIPHETYENGKNKGKPKGKWTGKPGNSTFIPADIPENKKIIDYLHECGLEGVDYKDGVPDFFFLSEKTVEIPDMTEHMFNAKDVVNAPFQIKPKDIRPDGQPGNFEQAYQALANKFNDEEKDERIDWTVRDVREWAKKNKEIHGGQTLTIHEMSDMKTCEFIRYYVHRFFNHSGGREECRIRDEQNGRWAEYKNKGENNNDGGFDE